MAIKSRKGPRRTSPAHRPYTDAKSSPPSSFHPGLRGGSPAWRSDSKKFKGVNAGVRYHRHRQRPRGRRQLPTKHTTPCEAHTGIAREGGVGARLPHRHSPAGTFRASLSPLGLCILQRSLGQHRPPGPGGMGQLLACTWLAFTGILQSRWHGRWGSHTTASTVLPTSMGGT